MKRALFKIGDEFGIYSQTLQNGFSCQLVVSDWIKKDEKEEDWRIPIEIRPPAKRSDLAGTFISVKRLHDEVKMRLRGGLVDNSLYKSVSRAYTFFIQRYVNVFLNGKEVKPFSIPLSKPTDGHASFDEFSDHGVNATIFATVAEPDDNGHYNQDQAGWYIVCNGRIVLHADKSDVSGWGISPMPTYQPKHRSFIGLVIFEAENPLLLPWTTTKRGLNRESPVYLRARSRMAVAARPVLSFIDKQYPGEVDEEPSERLIARSVKGATVGDLVQKHPAVFSAPVAKISKPKTTSRVQFDANISDLEKVRSHLRKPRMGASKIGEYALRYFLDKEGLS